VKKKNFKILIVVVIALSMLFSQNVFAVDTAGSTTGDKNLDYLKSVMDSIKDKYNGQITDNQLIEGAVRGMYNTMDPYTTFFDKDEAKNFFGDINGKYEGIGIAMEKMGDYATITKVFASSPAEQAGILPGDKIVLVGEKSVIGSTLEEIVSLVKGTAGTKVTVGIIRNSESQVRKFEITRAQITQNPVTYRIKGDIGYIKLDSFTADSGDYMTQAFNEMDKKNIKKIILDLRNNPGGYVDQAVAIGKKLVPEGLITKLEFKSASIPTEEYRSDLKQLKYKLAVLVNGNSASASEILAGAIQDTKAGTLIGTKTFGKGVVQQLYPLMNQDGTDLLGYTKITVGEYSTPNGRKINKVGLEPDVAVADYDLVKNIDVNNIGKLTGTSKLILNSEGLDVYNAEKILSISGYDIDTPDLKLDGKTLKAIAKYQKDFMLISTGVLDIDTQKAFNRKLDMLFLQMDKQYAKAVAILDKK
jgi:carboxyl-terminal processing protease